MHCQLNDNFDWKLRFNLHLCINCEVTSKGRSESLLLGVYEGPLVNMNQHFVCDEEQSIHISHGPLVNMNQQFVCDEGTIYSYGHYVVIFLNQNIMLFFNIM